jgi:hypothetical protein
MNSRQLRNLVGILTLSVAILMFVGAIVAVIYNVVVFNDEDVVDLCTSVCESNNLSYHRYMVDWITTRLYECRCLPPGCINEGFIEVGGECETKIFRKG